MREYYSYLLETLHMERALHSQKSILGQKTAQNRQK